jgi:hypothetical protein
MLRKSLIIGAGLLGVVAATSVASATPASAGYACGPWNGWCTFFSGGYGWYGPGYWGRPYGYGYRNYGYRNHGYKNYGYNNNYGWKGYGNKGWKGGKHNYQAYKNRNFKRYW